MKIRIKGNSIRFRLTQTEVKQLSEVGSVMETTNFGDSMFRYEVKLAPNLEDLKIVYTENKITLMIPKEKGKPWFHNDMVGFENNLTLPSGDKLHLLLEKDFTCLENRSEDESDNYPNPKMQH